MMLLRSLILLALAATSAKAQVLAPPPASGAPAPNPACVRLEAQLAAIDRGTADPARAEQIRRYEDAAARQQSELDRTVAQSRRLRCEGGGLFSIFTPRPEQCGPLTQQIHQMRANLDRILSDLEQIRGGSAERENQRRTVLSALAQNDCGPQYRAAAAQAQGGLLGALFGGGIISTPGDYPPATSSNYRTLCVRTCDGYYFPISYSTIPSRFAEDERVCQRMCPAAEVMLFAHRNPGEDINQAVSITGVNYTALPNAFRYRQTYDPSCSCRKPGQSWAEALEGRDSTIERGDIVVTEERARQLSQPRQTPRQRGRPDQPAAVSTTTPTSTTPAPPVPPTTADNPSGPATGKKPIRTVGPPFIPAQ